MADAGVECCPSHGIDRHPVLAAERSRDARELFVPTRGDMQPGELLAGCVCLPSQVEPLVFGRQLGHP